MSSLGSLFRLYIWINKQKKGSFEAKTLFPYRLQTACHLHIYVTCFKITERHVPFNERKSSQKMKLVRNMKKKQHSNAVLCDSGDAHYKKNSSFYPFYPSSPPCPKKPFTIHSVGPFKTGGGVGDSDLLLWTFHSVRCGLREGMQ